MQTSMRRASAFVASILLVLAGHYVWIYLAFQGLPVVNIRPRDEGLWLPGVIGRLLLYLGLGVLLVACWRRIAGTVQLQWWLCIPYALAVSAYWLVLDQGALFAVLGPERTWTWLKWVWGRPILSDLYWGWGASIYHWHFVGVQALGSAGSLLCADIHGARRLRATLS